MAGILVAAMFLLFCALLVSGAGLGAALLFTLFDRRWPAPRGPDAVTVRAGSRAALRRYLAEWMGSAALWCLVYLVMRLATKSWSNTNCNCFSHAEGAEAAEYFIS